MSLKLQLVLFAFLIICVSLISGCSTGYLLRASWEEVSILARRQSIKELVSAPETDDQLKKRLQLVLDARTFTTTIGLKPKKSYTKYSEVNREVLLWVLSACEKTSFSPETWWFPIVGSVPYKGFFDKDDALEDAKELQDQGKDIYLRPSAAFSTLGWFNDPLLSSVLAADDTDLVEIVIHEILHNTIWLNNNVQFNESLANFVGQMGSKEFFQQRSDDYQMLALKTANRWHDELRFAELIDQTYKELNELYQSSRNAAKNDAKDSLALSRESILEKRAAIFTAAELKWKHQKSELKSSAYGRGKLTLNNAVIIAQRIYLSKLQVFDDLYKASGENIKGFITEMKELVKKIEDEDLDPFDAVAARAKELQSKKN